MADSQTPKNQTSKKRPAKKSSNTAYDAASIQVLEGLDAVRKRPGMYIGGTGSDGLHHLLWELIDNGVDEAAAGFANLIEVTLHRDRSVEVSDNGRGIPIDKKRGAKTALEVVFTELHAGGKFGGGAYGASGGLHGVGASVVNALATKLVAEVDRDGVTHRLIFVDRQPGHYLKSGAFKPSSTLEKVKKIPVKRTGTRVRFWPDFEIFDPEARIDYATVRDHVARVVFLVPGLTLRLIDKRPDATQDKPEEFVSTGGLADLVDHLSIGEHLTDVVTIHDTGTFDEKIPVDGRMTSVTRECTVDVALRWVKGYDTTITSFVNTIPTSEGGTHITGFERAMNKAVNDHLLADNRKLKKLAKDGKDRAVREDVQEGLVAAVKVTFPEPQFRGQTKQELGTPSIQTITYDVVKDGIADWFDNGRKVQVGRVRDKITDAIINRVAAKAALETRRKAASLNSAGLPDKLADCRVHGLDSELLIVEGDSAAGPAKAGRDSETMAVLPLRGKVVNAGKATMKQVIENAEAQALFTAIGAGSGRDFDLEQARYGRIIILCDADVDGSHIRCLLLTLIYHYMRPLLENGRVYAAMPPLYSAKFRGETHYAYSDTERDAIIDEKNIPRDKWVRFKGLGEMDVEELAETTLDPASRLLKRMTIDDAREALSAGEVFDVLMGSDVGRRRDFVLAHSELIDPDALDI